MSVTSTGRVLISNQLSPGTPDGQVRLRYGGGNPCTDCDLTVTSNLGSSITVFLGKAIY